MMRKRTMGGFWVSSESWCDDPSSSAHRLRVIADLEKAGFERVRQRSSHVRMRHQDGRVVTVVVHGSRTLGKGLLRKILRDADLTMAQFLSFVE